MTKQDLAELVARMRAAQRKYFRDRGHSDLTESMRLEMEVDRAIKEIMETPLFTTME